MNKPDRPWRRVLQSAVFICIPVALLITLFWVSGATTKMLGTRLVEAPLWMWGLVLATTAAMQAMGAWKWLAMRRWLSPQSIEIKGAIVFELTTLGSLLAQVLPPQASHLLIRWWHLRNTENQNRGVVASTLFEHVFELVVYAGAALVAILYYAAGMSNILLTIATLIVVLGCILFFRSILQLCLMLSRRLHLMAPDKAYFQRAEEAMLRVREIPASLSTTVVAITILLLFGRCLTIAVITAALAPNAEILRVVAGFPGVALLSSLPITPAGLGVAEWSWSALLLTAGVTAPVAAIAALAFRLVNLICLIALALLLQIWNFASARLV